MGLFDKFKKERKVTWQKRPVFECDTSIDKSNYFEVFSACLGKVSVNQSACSDMVVKGRNWNVDFSKGIISFGDDSFPVQFIGSESSSSNTWLWGWANKSTLPENVLEEAKRLKQLGEAFGLAPLTEPHFQLSDSFNGHKLSIISSALNERNVCYYRGPHQGGAIFVEIYDIPDDVFHPISAKTFLDITMQLIQQFSVEHKIFITSFLFQNGTPYEWSGDTIVAHFNNGQKLSISFERAGDLLRIKKITGNI